METKSIQSVLLFLSVFLLSLSLIECTPSKKVVAFQPGDAQKMVNSHEFKFVAESANPLRLRVRHFTSRYDVIVKNDSLVSYLPYFGRAYQAPMNPSEGGIQFTSANFSYEAKPDKSNSWVITIKPEDQPGVQQFYFNIFDNGSATLNVSSTYRDPISFLGYIEKVNNN